MDIDNIVEIFHPDNRDKIPSYATAQRQANAWLRRNKAAESINVICRDIDGAVNMRNFKLHQTGSMVWNFIKSE